jgi:hypothetical protein
VVCELNSWLNHVQFRCTSKVGIYSNNIYRARLARRIHVKNPRQCVIPLPAINHLSFQQHSRLKRLSAFVFIHIPALAPSFPQRSFVFIDIPA